MELTKAAVLVPIVISKDNDPKVLYTVRTNSVPQHKGEVCFPGGRLERHDLNIRQAAIRETEEEIGISRDKITIIDELEGCSTASGYIVRPVVALIRGKFETQLCPREVADIFYIPLRKLIQHKTSNQYNNSNDKNIYGPRIQYNQHTIWGATAIITYQLLDAIATATATDVSIYNFHEMLEN
ncbi:MAG: CoA pyrophosphatase [Francisellaceae bacterium]|jgi:8-oxo-dGTP pyrophosphatase MutT (NUDIX family)|nr:CoA pyrophosphatase [Francisellaceae bacterium]MBT6539831.1 CoA pyrophosphatase [Francisellaceae bacterium]